MPRLILAIIAACFPLLSALSQESDRISTRGPAADKIVCISEYPFRHVFLRTNSNGVFSSSDDG